MTVQEAIKVLEVFTTEKFQCLTSSEFDDAICCAIEALEKQIKLEEVVARLEEEIERSQWEKGVIQAHYFEQGLLRAIEIVKEGMG